MTSTQLRIRTRVVEGNSRPSNSYWNLKKRLPEASEVAVPPSANSISSAQAVSGRSKCGNPDRLIEDQDKHQFACARGKCAAVAWRSTRSPAESKVQPTS